MIARLICAAFAVCGPGAPSDGLPSWHETAEIAVPLVARWEGTGPTFACEESPSGVCVRAYLDTLPDPDVPTICYGQTRGVRMDMTRTIEECQRALRDELRDPYWLSYRSRVTVDALPVTVDAAMTSLAWNIGWGGIWSSTALRRLNAGDHAGACEALTWWNKSGSRVIRGLVNRRADEKRLCLAGT